VPVGGDLHRAQTAAPHRTAAARVASAKGGPGRPAPNYANFANLRLKTTPVLHGDSDHWPGQIATHKYLPIVRIKV
jgi:hypothetical protein